MSPIKGVSEIRRLPRLGKIHLGEKKISERTGNPYPVATDYFVTPDEIKQYVGEKPKSLLIMFPVEDQEIFAQQWLRCYSLTQGLVCKGDGVAAVRKVDVATGDIATHDTEEWVFHEWTCDPDHCPEYLGDIERDIKPRCRKIMNLMFMLPQVPGLGVWQLDTSSFHSIVNINSCLDVIRAFCGRIRGVPLTLSLEPREVSPPGIKKKVVQVLHLRSDLKIGDLQRLALKPPAVEKAEMPSVQEEEPPEDLYPQEVLAVQETKPPARPERSPWDITENDVPDYHSAMRLCYQFWGMQPADIAKEMGYSSAAAMQQAGTNPWHIFQTVRGSKEPRQKVEEAPPSDLARESDDLFHQLFGGAPGQAPIEKKEEQPVARKPSPSQKQPDKPAPSAERADQRSQHRVPSLDNLIANVKYLGIDEKEVFRRAGVDSWDGFQGDPARASAIVNEILQERRRK